MSKLARFAPIVSLSLFAILGNACTMETEEGFVAYGAMGGETGDFDDQEAEPAADEGSDELCGDGVVDEDEECDDGDMNADNAACTASCAINTCGDGLVFEGVEECDMGVLNGENSSCNSNCENA